MIEELIPGHQAYVRQMAYINRLKTEGSEWVNDNDPDDDVTFVVIKVK